MHVQLCKRHTSQAAHCQEIESYAHQGPTESDFIWVDFSWVIHASEYSPQETLKYLQALKSSSRENQTSQIYVVSDYFTKWPEAYPLSNQEATTVAQVLVKEFVSRFGVPKELHSDQGRNFESSVFQEMYRFLGIKKTRTTALHPQSDGMVEHYNRTLATQLCLFVDNHQKDWDQHVPLLLRLCSPLQDMHLFL